MRTKIINTILPVILILVALLLVVLYYFDEEYSMDSTAGEVSVEGIITSNTWHHHESKEDLVFFIHPNSPEIVKNFYNLNNRGSFHDAETIAMDDCKKLGGELSSRLSNISNYKAIFICSNIDY